MPTVRRGTITSKMADSLKLDTLNTGVVNQASEKLVLTYDYSNANNSDWVKSINKNATGTINLATPTDKDLYITRVHANCIKDATCNHTTNPLAILSCTSNGATVQLLCWAGITLTAQTADLSNDFEAPIKVDRGTNITSVMNYAAGVCIIGAEVIGYTVDG